jgi:putative ABC transport system permease protein
MGFTERQIMLSLALEGALLGFLASIVGIIFAALVLIIVTSIIKFITLDLVLPIWLILAAMVLTIILSFISGLYPAWLASKNDVSLVFKNE